MRNRILFILSFLFSSALYAQQIADTSYHPAILSPAYSFGKGPVVFIDEGHHNFHTKNGRYISFAHLLERDGYSVKEYQGEFKKQEMAKGKILVISNALNQLNTENWYLPNPSAFTKTEIEVLKTWVHEGGSLFLIADHMPMAGAASDLAAVFGFEFSNGFVLENNSGAPSFFNLKENTLVESIITKGSNANETVEQVVTFTGQGFNIPADATPILVFNEIFTNLLPDTAWVFNEKTKRQNVKGWSQGAYKKFGKGRVVAFGEAAMFSAQLAGPQRSKTGMNSPIAGENYKLLLNIIHWLDGKLN